MDILIDTNLERNDTCTLTVDNKSKAYFQSRIEVDEPNFIYFFIKFNGITPNSTGDALYPYKWVWTYATSDDVYPFMHWKIDYDLFSFSLLDSKTLRIPYINFDPSGICNLTLGTLKTTELIAKSLGSIIRHLDPSGFKKYRISYWCFLADVPGIKQTVQYFLGLYLDYPVSAMQYNCCTTSYHFEKAQYINTCLDKQMEIWPQCTLIPFIFGILLFLYYPIFQLDIWAFLSKNEKIFSENRYIRRNSNAALINPIEEEDDDSTPESDRNDDLDWIYLDGVSPITFSDLFRDLFRSSHMKAISRIRRAICVLLTPTLIYIKLIMYGIIQFKTTNAMMDRGVPFGFLSLIANTPRGRSISFVPALGGPITIVLMFYIFSMIFFVLPSSLKRIVQSGLPSTPRMFAPLCYSAKQIREMAQIPFTDDPGYKNAANHMRCSFFMLFSSVFWRKFFKCQVLRCQEGIKAKTGFRKIICISLLPVYCILCMAELLAAVFYYAFPLFGILVIIIRGATIYIENKMRRGGRVSHFLLNNKLFVAASTMIMAIMVTFYFYSLCLVFIESFIFLSEFFVYSYLAVIIFPAISFGYLFFAVVLGYYVIRLIRGFGHRYLDLLNDVVEITLNIEQQDNYVTNFDGNLIISNVKIRTVKSIKVNDLVFPVPRNMREGFNNTNTERKDRLGFRNDAYGIRKDLFEYVISKHMPVHQQVLKVVFQLVLIAFMLLFTLTVTRGYFTGPTSQITEVMHVMFIVTIGALPRVLEVAMSDSSEHIERDLKMRKLERTICQFWRERETCSI